MYGARTSLVIATIAVIVATFIGVVLGLVAGFVGGVADRIISFVTDVFFTLPFLLMALAIAPICRSASVTTPSATRRPRSTR